MNRVDHVSHRPAAIAVAIGRCLAATTLSAGLAGAAFAQEGSVQAAVELDRVNVTAQKREEPIKEVPMAISVVDASKLADRGAVQLTDYFAQVPGLSINARGAGRTQIILRGITAGAAGNPTVGVTIDDAPYGSSSARGSADSMIPDLDPSQLQHIEVLRGPQGTLYGASSMGGLLKYVTAAPDLEVTSGRVQFDAKANDGDSGYGARSSVNLPLVSGKFALRASVFQREDPGYVDDVLQNREDINAGMARGARMAALWQAADNVTVRASAMFQNSRTGATPNEDVYLDHTPVYREYAHARLVGTDGFEGNTRFYDATVNVDLGWASFDSITAYGQHRHDGPQDVSTTFGGLVNMIFGLSDMGVVIDNQVKTDKFSQEFRLASADQGQTLNWMLGAFYTREESEGYQRLRVVDPQTGVGLGLPLFYESRSPSVFTEKALFANFTYRFTERFDTQFGGRYSQSDESYEGFGDGILAGGPTYNSGGSGENVFTYSLTPRFKVSEQTMWYARVASGYRNGGKNEQIPGSTAFVPETFGSDNLVNYEVGLKGEYFDRSLSVDASLFYIDWTDIQLLQVDQSTGSGFWANAGKARSQGLETTIMWRPAAGLTVTASAVYTDAELMEDTEDGTFGRRGDRLPYSARETASLSVVKDFPVGRLLGYVGGNVSYVGERDSSFGNTAASPRFVMPSYNTIDLNAGLQGDRWNLAVFVKNLGDSKGYLSSIARNATTGVSAFGAGLMQPRTYGVSLSLDY